MRTVPPSLDLTVTDLFLRQQYKLYYTLPRSRSVRMLLKIEVVTPHFLAFFRRCLLTSRAQSGGVK
jgi:hypothetical protein